MVNYPAISSQEDDIVVGVDVNYLQLLIVTERLQEVIFWKTTAVVSLSIKLLQFGVDLVLIHLLWSLLLHYQPHVIHDRSECCLLIRVRCILFYKLGKKEIS